MPKQRTGMQYVRTYEEGWNFATIRGVGIVAVNPNHPPELNGKVIKPLFPDGVLDFSKE